MRFSIKYPPKEVDLIKEEYNEVILAFMTRKSMIKEQIELCKTKRLHDLKRSYEEEYAMLYQICKKFGFEGIFNDSAIHKPTQKELENLSKGSE